MSAADDWFLLDEVDDEVLIMMPDRRMVRGKVVHTLADSQPPAPLEFDAAEWLASFTEAGGSYALTPEGRLWLGGIHAPAEPWENVSHLVGHPERVDAIKALVRERCLIA